MPATNTSARRNSLLAGSLLLPVVFGEIMTAANNQYSPDGQQAASIEPAKPAASGGPETSALKSRRVKLTIYIASAIIGIPFVTVLALILWVLVNYFIVQR